MAARTILVTGGAGFIGSHLARALAERDDDVVLLDSRPAGPKATWLLQSCLERVRFVEGGVETEGMIRSVCEAHGVTDVVHLAAIGDPAALERQPRKAFDVNLGGTLNVLEAAHALSLNRVIFFSSIGVLPTVQYEPIDARHPVLLEGEGPGTGFYGAAKVASEAFCFAYRKSFGVDFVILRPSAVYGFGMQHPIFIKPMVEKTISNEPVHFAKGRDFPRDYTHVEDVVQITLRALDVASSSLTNRIFYAATGEPLVTAGTVAEIVRTLLPNASIEIGPGLSDSDRLEILYRGVLDIKPARYQLGYQPRYARLEDGLRQYIEAHRTYLAMSDPVRLAKS